MTNNLTDAPDKNKDSLKKTISTKFKQVIFDINDSTITTKNITPGELVIAENSLEERIKYFSVLPYKKYPYNKRNWGHNWHGLCSYQSRLKASIANHLVLTFTSPKQKVLDPFSGVGTIPFESCLNGRIGVGVDINPVAYHCTLAKVNAPKKIEVLKCLDELHDFIANSNIDEKDSVDDYTRNFYHKDTLNEILIARKFFLKKIEKDDPPVSFLLAAMLHILHGNRPYALSRQSHNLIPLAPRGPTIYKNVISSLRNKIDLSYKGSLPDRFVKGNAKLGSVFELPCDDSFFDAILTSPPFWGSTRFYANNRIRLWFCGWDYHSQNKKGKTEFLEERQKESFLVYKDVFMEFSRVLKNDGICVLHLGIVKNRDIGKEITPFAEKVGFKLVDIIYENNTSSIERHGMTDQGATKRQQFLILKKK